MADNKRLDLKTEKLYRFIFRVLFTLVSVVIPIVIISFRYKVFSEFSGYKLSVIGIILCVIIVWHFKNQLLEWINTWEYSIMKYILLGFSKVYIFILMLVLLLMARQGIEDLIFCIEWISLCECISYLVIYPLQEKHDYNVKRILRGIERKEDYRDVINELGGIK